MPLLQVEDLTKSFKNTLGLLNPGYFHAVEEISFSLEAGKTLAIIGRNGSGKSTLAKMIVGIIEPTSGKILFKDKLEDKPSYVISFSFFEGENLNFAYNMEKNEARRVLRRIEAFLEKEQIYS